MRSAWGLDTLTADWHAHAACSPDTAEWFWLANSKPGPTSGRLSADNRAALDLCHACPVRQQCYDEAQANPEQFPRIAGGVLWTAAGTPQRVTA